MLVALDNISKSFGDKLILSELSVTIEDTDRIGLVGANGIGKSTLLNVICKRLAPDTGTVAVTNGKTIGFLEQNSGLSRANTIHSEMREVFKAQIQTEAELRALEAEISSSDSNSPEYQTLLDKYAHLTAEFEAADGYQIEVKIKTILNGMGFSDKSYDMDIGSLSGGEKTRLALSKLLLESPDLLILDEPTNHLDFKTLLWLEDYLKSYKGGLLVVSHDRYFLDKMVTKMWEVENKKIISYNGNYTKYRLLREERMTRMMKEYEAQQNKINSMIDYAQKNIVRASTSNMAKSRLHQLEHIEVLEKPVDIVKTPSFSFTFERNPVKDLLTVRNLKLTVGEGADEITLCENISFDIKKGDKVALIGPNGIGKSTLLKVIQGLLPPKGEIYWGDKVEKSYYEQENMTLNHENTALEELWSRFPRKAQHEVRGLLGQVLITGDNSFKKIGVLSGGERARVALSIIMAEHSNTLILDEPTNHLDLQSKEKLEQSLIDFEGTLLFVSHDRYFLNTIPNRIIELSKSGLTCYGGNFDFYLEEATKSNHTLEFEMPKEKGTPSEAAFANADPSTNEILSEPKSGYRSKQERAEQTKLKNRIKSLETSLAEIDEQIASLEIEIASPEAASDYERLNALCHELEEKKSAHEEMFFEWAELSE